jgi:hypothetical protein
MGESGIGRRGRARRTRLGLCGVILAVFAGGCGGSAPDASAEVEASSPLYSEGAAAAAASALLAAVPLPEDTQQVTAPAQAVAGKPGRPRNSEDAAKSVDRYAYWSSTNRPEAILTLIAKMGPISKVAYSGSGGTAGKTEDWSETLSAPLASPLAGPQELFVSIELDGSGHYAVRVDAVATWHQPRPADSLIPATARWLRVTVVTPAFRPWNRGEPTRVHSVKSFITTDAATVGAVAQAVNELPLAEPSVGPAPSCFLIEPAHESFDAPRYQLTFRTSARTLDLARVIGVSGTVCERGGGDTAKITTPEEPQGVQLTDHLNRIGPSRGQGLAEHLELTFRHRLRLIPES